MSLPQSGFLPPLGPLLGPPLRHLLGYGLGRLARDLRTQARAPLGPPLAPSLATGVQPRALGARVLGAREPAARRPQRRLRAVPVGRLRAAGLGLEDRPFGVHREAALCAPDLLVAVAASPTPGRPTPVVSAVRGSAIPALGGGFVPRRLRGRPRGAALSRPRVPSSTPPPEPPTSGLPGREASGQQPPRAAALWRAEDGVEDLAGVAGPRSSSLVGGRDTGLQAPPPTIGWTARMAPSRAHERASSTHPSRFPKQFLHAPGSKRVWAPSCEPCVS
jgi:hypothetical protein